MPLIIGIENGLEKNMSEEELDFTNGFGFGILMINAGMGGIESVESFYYRVKMTAMITKIYPAFPRVSENVWFTRDLVQRMHDAGWRCNVSTYTVKEWEKKMKNTLFEEIERRYTEEEDE